MAATAAEACSIWAFRSLTCLTISGFAALATACAAIWLPLTNRTRTRRSITIAITRGFDLGQYAPAGGSIVAARCSLKGVRVTPCPAAARRWR